MITLTGPTLQDAGSVAPDNCSGSGGQDATTHATLRSRGPRLYRSIAYHTG